MTKILQSFISYEHHQHLSPRSTFYPPSLLISFFPSVSSCRPSDESLMSVTVTHAGDTTSLSLQGDKQRSASLISKGHFIPFSSAPATGHGNTGIRSSLQTRDCFASLAKCYSRLPPNSMHAQEV